MNYDENCLYCSKNDEGGNRDPVQITFVYKTGFKSSVNGDKFKPQRKNARGRHRADELYPHDDNEVEKMCSNSVVPTHRQCGKAIRIFITKFS